MRLGVRTAEPPQLHRLCLARWYDDLRCYQMKEQRERAVEASQTQGKVSRTETSECALCKKIAKIAIKEKRRFNAKKKSLNSLTSEYENCVNREKMLKENIINLKRKNDKLKEEIVELTSENIKLKENLKKKSSSLHFTTEELNRSRAEFSKLNQKIVYYKAELDKSRNKKKEDFDIEIIEDSGFSDYEIEYPQNDCQGSKSSAKATSTKTQNKGSLQCPICFKTFKRACALGSHRRVHKKE